MQRYLVRRLGFAILTLWVLTIAVFVAVKSIPGDAALFVAGVGATSEQVEIARRLLGLDQPYIVQYGLFLKKLLLEGDLGISVVTNRPVLTDLLTRVPASLELAFLATIFGAIVGLPLGAWAAIRKGSFTDTVVRVVGLIGVSIPTFWLALLTQIVFFKQLGWLPLGGRLDLSYSFPSNTGFILLDSIISGNFSLLLNYLSHLVLPAFCLSQSFVALFVRVFRSSMLDVLGQDYITVARAKGLSEFVVVSKHVAKNALVPVVSLMGNYFGLMVGDAILIETVFNWPGVGTYIVQSIFSFDFPALTGAILFTGSIFLLGNLLVDLAHAWLNPSIHYD